MKSKQPIQLTRAMIIFLALFLFSPVYSVYNLQIQTEESNRSKIVLEGMLRQGGLRSGTDPIVVEIQDKVMLITFQKDVGNINISMTNESGENVYTNTVNSAGLPSFNIFLTHLPAGNYTISFSNERGMMWGEFIL